MQLSFAIIIAALSLSACARVAWIPAEFDPHEEPAVYRRDVNDSITCGDAFPSDFTCPQSTTCLPLSTNASIKAVLCCPAGQGCTAIAPISCDISFQNVTLHPVSQLHSDPPTPLQSCGPACCPMGYTCVGNSCRSEPGLSSLTTSSTTPPTTISTSSSATSAQPTMSQTTSAATANATGVSVLPVGISSGSPSKFSGASFAAGFIPGIFLGILATACLLLILFRKRRGSADSYMDEKQSPRDTLTDLATLSRRPTMHGRSISEPAMDPTAVHRTDFLRGTPPRSADPLAPMQANYTVEATGPVTPARTPKAVKALFSHSPFMNQTPSTPPSTQPPMPAHLKRGTLSFKISPVRALKKQKSMHSLRRQMTSVSRSSSRRTRPDVSRSGSTETIQVLMPSNEPYTPDQRLRASAEQAPSTSESFVNHQQQTSVSSPTSSDSSSASTARPFAPTAYASSTRFPVNTSTPARQPNRDMEATLGTPYTPSRYYGNGKGRATDVLLGNDGGLRVIREPEKRDTTFSGMMAKAGLRESDLTMGTAGR